VELNELPIDNVNISIIIPVYNVYEYLDECLESIVHQTYKNFEILLVNDGSTDGSDRKCQEWEKKDGRIRYISKQNEGHALTVNLGIKEAAGRYIVFIDADDWVENTYIEELYVAIEKNNADFAECDFWRYNNNTGEKTYRTCYGGMGIDYTLEEHMIYGQTMRWKSMSKKSLWIDNDIQFPNCISSAHAVYALILALSRKTVNIRKPLYYYRRFRKGSIVDTSCKELQKNNVLGLYALEFLLVEFKRFHLYYKFEETIEQIATYSLSNYLAAQYTRMKNLDYRQLSDMYYRFIERQFPEISNDKYILLGGYNLNRILTYIRKIQDPYCRFNFSSIISIMSSHSEIPDVVHKNPYRKKMIDKDIKQMIWKIIEEKTPKYIFIDFIEERFDLIQMQDGGYITKSDAIDDLELNLSNCEILKRDTKECTSIWKESFLKFIEKIKKHIDDDKIVIVKNYLSEYVGTINKKKLFNNISDIRRINEILTEYYDFAIKSCPEAKVIETIDLVMYFTDENYEYGAVPSHLNWVVNAQIAERVKKMIGI